MLQNMSAKTYYENFYDRQTKLPNFTYMNFTNINIFYKAIEILHSTK